VTITPELLPCRGIDLKLEWWTVIDECVILSILTTICQRRIIVIGVQLKDVIKPIRVELSPQIRLAEKFLINSHDDGFETA